MSISTYAEIFCLAIFIIVASIHLTDHVNLVFRMTAKDQNLVETLDLSYSDIARMLGVSRQTVRQGMFNEYKDYLDRDRLGQIYEGLRERGDAERAAVIEPLLQSAAGDALRPLGAGVVLGPEWSEMFCISSDLALPRYLLTELARVAVGRRATLHLYSAQDPAALAGACRELPGQFRVELGRWPAAACLPPLLYIEHGEGPAIDVVVAAPDGETFSFTPAGKHPIPGRSGTWPDLSHSQWVESRAPVRAREHAQGKSSSRRVFDFDLGPGGHYRLVMEHADDWGWLLRLECRAEPAAVRDIAVHDSTGREWLRVRSDVLPYQLIWPAGWPEPDTLASQGLFMEPEEQEG